MKKYCILIITFLCLTYVGNIYAQNTKESKTTKATNSTENSDNTVEIQHLNKETFKELVWDYEKFPKEFTYQGDIPCIIDFYANWCGPCRQLAPKLSQLAEEYKDKITIYKINIDQEKELAALFGVRSIPAILFVPKSNQPQMGLGNLPKENLVEAINNVLLIKQ
ncbi:thioredoxin [Odoribacter sp. OttesenSCG-928-L07]|nr:thioredoxin [Odoribacter sp. OttesenSCG-928-L07]